MTFPVDPAAPVPPDGEKWDASNCVRFCDRCDAEYGITAGADAGDDACAGCGNLTAPHIYPHPRFAAGRAAATPDPPDAADLVAAHLRERWPCTCRPGMDGGGVYHAADCNSRREGSQAVLAVIRLLRAADPPASPDERLREAVRDARDHAYVALLDDVPHDRIIDHLRDIWEACSAALAAEDRDEPPCACDGERICAQHTPLAAADREAPDEEEVR